jgi:hypothetical protein
MAIKVTIGESKTQEEKPFPKLMMYNGDNYTTIVHFNSKCDKGIQVYSDNKDNKELQMKETDNWNIHLFNDYEGSITLQNQ